MSRKRNRRAYPVTVNGQPDNSEQETVNYAPPEPAAGRELALAVDGNSHVTHEPEPEPVRHNLPAKADRHTAATGEAADKENVFPSFAMLKDAVQKNTIGDSVYLQWGWRTNEYVRLDRPLVAGVLDMIEKRCSHCSIKSYINNGWFSPAEMFGVHFLIQNYRNS